MVVLNAMHADGGIAKAREAKPIDARAAELIGRRGRVSDVGMMLRVAERLQPKPPGSAMLNRRQSAWGGRHEKSLSCQPSACHDDRSACDGGGLATRGAASASSGVLRLVRRLCRLQRGRDALQRHAPLPV